jgi:hypothetical protein
MSRNLTNLFRVLRVKWREMRAEAIAAQNELSIAEQRQEERGHDSSGRVKGEGIATSPAPKEWADLSYPIKRD